MKPLARLVCLNLVTSFLTSASWAQAPQPPAPENPNREAPRPPDAAARPDGPPAGRLPGFGPMMQDTKLVERFDKDGDKRLDAEERKAAREFLAKERAEGRGGRFGRGPGMRPPGQGRPGVAQGLQGGDGRPPGGPGGFSFGPRENQAPPQPGRKLAPGDVKNYPAMPLFDSQTLRTLFFEFENPEWEKELADFHRTDVDVPAKLTLDGRTYDDVGVHFHGMSSFMMVGEGRKRSISVSFDFEHGKQDLKGYKSIDLLNSHEDPSFLRAVLYYQIAREYLPAPKANFVRLVINGESWGIYVNKQHFDKDLVSEWYGSKKGARWKAPGSPMGRAGLEYTGEDVAEYKRRFDIKSKDDPKAWADLINLCRTLNQTPAEELEAKLAPIFDIDGALRFLALDNALINNDGYWIRASDYSLIQDEEGRFHVLPHDANEAFSVPGGPGFGGRGGPGGGRFGGPRPGGSPGDAGEKRPDDRAGDRPPQGPGGFGGPGFGGGSQIKGVELDPLIAAKDLAKPLASKLLAVPALRERYLGYVRDIAEKWLDWERLGPIAKQYASLIAEDVKADTRKLESTEAFERSIEGKPDEAAAPRGPQREISLKSFAEQRRAYLLNYPAIQALNQKTAAK